MAKASKPAATPAKPVARTEVRNSPIPQAPTAPPRSSVPKTTAPQSASPRSASAAAGAVAARPGSKTVSQELIARRAYEIWASGQGGTDLANWVRAERELRGM